MSDQKIIALGLSAESTEWVPQVTRFLLDRLGRKEFSRVALYGESRSAAPLAQELLKVGLSDYLTGSYDKSHPEFDAFNRHPQYLATDKADVTILCVGQGSYRSATRYLCSNVCKFGDLVLPFSTQATEARVDLREMGFENKRPTLIHLFPCAGANRLWAPVDALFAAYERPARYEMLLSDNSRYIEFTKNRGGDFAEIAQDDIDQQVKALARNLRHYEYAIVHNPFSLEVLKPFTDIQVVVLLRDPRDIVNSYFHRSYGSGPNAADDYKNQQLTDERIMRMLAGGCFPLDSNYFLIWPSIKKMVSDFCALLDCPHAYFIRFEDLRANARESYRSLLSWLELDRDVFRGQLSDPELDSIMHLGSFEHQTGGARKEGEEHSFIYMKDGVQTSCRKGVAGDWKNYFSESVKDYLKREVGEGLIKLGYEKDFSW